MKKSSGSPVAAVRPAYTTQSTRSIAPSGQSVTALKGDFEIEEGTRVFVPPGIYNVAFVTWWTGLMFGKARKLGLTFEISDFGDHFRKRVMRWYNVRRFIGPTGVHGRFQATKGSEFIADYVRLVGMPTRTDRASLTKYEAVLIKAEIVTVKSNSVQSNILDPLQYSVIRKLISVETGVTEHPKAA
jgi:hypothetical protein